MSIRVVPRFLLFTLIAVVPTLADEGGMISSMDQRTFRPPRTKGTVGLVEGKVGKAGLFRFEDEARSTFFTSNLRGSPEWDQAAGFSFWVRGTNTDGFGGLQFIYDDNYRYRYDFCFPIKGADWTKIEVAWEDLIPNLPGPRAKPLGTPDGNLPSKLSALWIGTWWYWGESPAISFAIDEIRLEPAIERERRDFRPEGPPLARLLAKLKAGEPITVVTMGDSLTDKRHWANREVAWVDLLRDRLKKAHRSEVRVVNPAIGGTQLRQNLVLIPRWLDLAPEPDLVTVFFGGNDWEAGMRGEEFERACADAVDRIRRATKGRADVLLLTTNPTATRWTETTELAEACRKAAHARDAGLADTEKAFHAAGQTDRDRLYVQDRVHLSREGHDLVAAAVQEAIEAGGR